MLTSLLLLVAFLFFWLLKEYEGQRKGLQTEAAHVLIGSIRAVEDSLFQEMAMHPLHLTVMADSLAANLPMLRNKQAWRVKDDSTRVVTIMRSQDMNDIGHDSLRVSVRRQRRKDFRHRAAGALSFHLAETDAVENRTPIPFAEVETFLAGRVAPKMQQRGIDIPYSVTSWKVGDKPTAGLFSPAYLDFMAEREYSVHLKNYRGLLLGRMLPQILFSLFLFAMTALAFLMMYRTLRRQRRLAILKSSFMSNMTHELKTPITTVGVALEAMRNFQIMQNPEKRAEYLDISQAELDRLSLLVDKVLKMNVISGEEPQLKIEHFDFQDVVRNILRTMKVQFENLAARVQFNAEGNDFTLKGDKTHLTNVVYNLIDNALKYSPDRPEIAIELIQANGNLKLLVQDRGMGIDKTYQSRIFDKFFRIPSGDTHNVKGHGLGLSYVANIVTLHEGRISVDSKAGEGSTFEITLPRE